MPNAKGNLEKLKDLLAELFQFERADLDFGIYRIMNQKRAEITRFLEQDLLPQAKEAFKAYEAENKTAIEAELAKAVEHANGLGVDPETVPKVRELRQKATEAADLTALEQEVYCHLYNFFRRYYQDGDFLSLRRYKEGVYAIPYEGEEVKLHWANNDQYYIKTSEFLRDYTFKLPSGRRVHLKLTQAQVDKDNTRPPNGAERRFILASENTITEENGELVIRFEFRTLPEKRKQTDLNAETIDRILKKTKNHKDWLTELAQPRPTEKNPARTLLEKHLDEYTARHTFDYFIHKDLATFLRRELDFYIKNEVMHLDDIEEATAPGAEQYLNMIKAIRAIANKIITFLAHIEDFQKTLWLKKKFVIETNYCITLDRIPEQFYPEIAKNDAQREEWVQLFGINEIKKDLTRPGYTKPLTVEFLKANPYLVLDTKLFDQSFKDRLLALFDDLDSHVDGLLVKSESFQAINLLAAAYKGSIKSMYLDPPFNTGGSGFIYKNGYRHSSWCSMIANLMAAAQPLLQPGGVGFVAIDDYELHDLGKVLDAQFTQDNNIGILVVENKPSGRTNDFFLATCHEYYLCYSPNPSEVQINFFPLSEEERERYAEKDKTSEYKWRDFLRTGGYSTPEERPNSFYPIYYNEKTSDISLEPSKNAVEILPLDSTGRKRVWRKTRQPFMDHVRKSEIMVKKGRDGSYKIYIKDRIKEGIRPKSVWVDPKYDSSSHGTKLLTAILGVQRGFDYPKSLHAVKDILKTVTSDDDEIVLDFFGGSGTTAHAVIELNHEDDCRRKYVQVEMADYFDTVLKPRVQKVIYSRDWKEGKPVSRQGSSHMFKYMRIESYEDTLNNLELARTEAQQKLLQEYKEFRESYMLSYMMDVETKGSPSLLKVDAFEDPLNYSLNIATGSVGETRPTTVDLIETFNYLLGLKVKCITVQDGFRIVTGTNPDGQNVLVIWRNLKKHTNKALEGFFREQKFNAGAEQRFDIVYVNGDNTLENLRRETHTWKVRLIEEEFQRLMFDFKTA